jgi:RNA-directed DNA polymerase
VRSATYLSTRSPLAYALSKLRRKSKRQLQYRSRAQKLYGAGRDWKGDLVTNPFAFLDITYRIDLPDELKDEESLLLHLGVSQAELKKIWWYRSRMYHHFDVGKGKRKKRMISAPDRRLKMLQRTIAASLNVIYKPRRPVHGFVIDRSVKSNALSHLNSKFVLNLDLKDFFPSITENRVSGLLNALGIDARVSEIIARICCDKSQLPQGAPSSPVISNMICFKLDKELQVIAKAARCIYTRYADDITFSSYQPLTLLFEGVAPPAGNISAEVLSKQLREAFQNNGFTINTEKAHYADRHSRRTVTGLKVNEILNVDRKYVRNVRAALYIVEKAGVEAAQKRLEEKYNKRSSIASHLRGRIAWIGNIKGWNDPTFRSIALRFNNCFPKDQLKIEPDREEIINRSVWLVEHSLGSVKKMAQGTAFFLKGVGLVTAAHCVQNGKGIVVYHPSKPSNKFPVNVANSCKYRDLAILSHSISDQEFYELDASERSFKAKDNLTAYGYPGFGPGDKLNVRPGYVNSLPVKSSIQLIEVSQKLAQGMSGGPILDDDGHVAGIIHKGGPEEARDFGVHIQVLVKWLKDLRP